MERAFNLVSFGSHYATHIPEFDECKLLINRSILRREILASFDGFHDHSAAPISDEQRALISFRECNSHCYRASRCIFDAAVRALAAQPIKYTISKLSI